MADRYTKRHAQTAFEHLCKAMGKTVAKSYQDKGCWALSYDPTWGGYVVVEYAERGGELNPFGHERHNAREFYQMCWFAIRAIEIMEAKS